MNALQDRVQDAQRLRLEADLAARIEALFRRCPALCGFAVDRGLFISNLGCHPALDREQAAELCDEISHALLELLDEWPEADELLRGRTFARTLH